VPSLGPLFFGIPGRERSNHAPPRARGKRWPAPRRDGKRNLKSARSPSVPNEP
jgi:hypothetical protein